jgi:hypothetical protein
MESKQENKMKLIKTASGKKTVKLSKKEWESIGKKAGWMKTSATVSSIPAQVQVIEGGAMPYGQEYNFVLQLDVAGYSVNLPQTGETSEIYQAVKEQMGQQTQAS